MSQFDITSAQLQGNDSGHQLLDQEQDHQPNEGRHITEVAVPLHVNTDFTDFKYLICSHNSVTSF